VYVLLPLAAAAGPGTPGFPQATTVCTTSDRGRSPNQRVIARRTLTALRRADRADVVRRARATGEDQPVQAA